LQKILEPEIKRDDTVIFVLQKDILKQDSLQWINRKTENDIHIYPETKRLFLLGSPIFVIVSSKTESSLLWPGMSNKEEVHVWDNNINIIRVSRNRHSVNFSQYQSNQKGFLPISPTKFISGYFCSPGWEKVRLQFVFKKSDSALRSKKTPLIIHSSNWYKELKENVLTESSDLMGFDWELTFHSPVCERIEIHNYSPKETFFLKEISYEKIPEQKPVWYHSVSSHLNTLEKGYRINQPEPKKEQKEEFLNWQKRLRDNLRKALGDWPDKKVELNPKTIYSHERGLFKREKIEFWSEEGVSVPAILLIPRRFKSKLPAVIALHGNAANKEMVVGIQRNNPDYDFGYRLMKKGYVVLAIDHRGWGERYEELKGYHRNPTKTFLLGRNTTGLRVWDCLRAVDYLETRPEVDASQISCVGMSMGAEIALLATALDRRIKAAIISGWFGTFKHFFIERYVGPEMLIPGILKYGELVDIAGLIAPRPLFIEIGRYDTLINIEESMKAFEKLKQIYSLYEVQDKLGLDLFEGGHIPYGKNSFPWLKRQLMELR